MQITFYGAARGVTGSKHLVQIGHERILLDCGMFQGHRREARLLNSTLPFKPSELNAIVLSHGHLDHCGLLPLAVKLGYQGKIYATAATRDVAAWIMKDAAHIQKQDARYMNRHRIEGAELAVPLYTVRDVERVIERFVAVPYARQTEGWFSLEPFAPHFALKFYDAGHILGSSVAVIQGEENGHSVRLAFTGDLGRTGTPLLPDPEYIREDVTTLLMESTYGHRYHQPISGAIETLVRIVNQVYAQHGKIIVPSFALGRTQELVYVLHKLTDAGRVPRIPIFVDSPLATRLTDVFINHPENYDQAAWEDFGKRGELPLAFRNLNYVRTEAESKALNTRQGPFMVISASGMCEAGRILHHLLNGLEEPRNVILITGFQAMDTLGRKLVEGARRVKAFGKQLQVKAKVVVLNEFSAHADAHELQNYAEKVPNLRRIFLVHGEDTQAQELKLRLSTIHPEWQVVVPERNQTVVIED